MNRDLELAKRVFPAAYANVIEFSRVVRVRRDKYSGWVLFDPLGKHFPDVLAWLLKRAVLTGEVLSVDVSDFDADAVEYDWIHNGTAEGIAQAVYKAAIIIVEADQ